MTDMTEKWYLSRNGKSQGPYTREELVILVQAGDLRPQDRVLNLGTGKRMRADRVLGLFSGLGPRDRGAAGKTANTVVLIVAAGLSLLLLMGVIGLIWSVVSSRDSDTPQRFERAAPKMATWTYESRISESIVGETGEQDLTLGDLEADGISVTIPKDAFDTKTIVSLFAPTDPIEYDMNAFTPVGSPARLEIQGEQRRTNEPIIITMRVEPSILAERQETGGFRGIHGTETGDWTYRSADEVNVEQGYVRFHAYHNFVFGTAELTEAERIDQFVKKRSVQTWGQQQFAETAETVTREMIREILVQEFNVSNRNELDMVANLLADQITDKMKGSVTIWDNDGVRWSEGSVDWGGAIGDLSQGDYSAFSINVATTVGDTMALYLQSDRLSQLFGNAADVAAVAGRLWEGNLSDAGMELAEIVASKSAVYNAAKVAADFVDARVHNWKNDEVERAYILYRDGAESRWPWGYNVDRGDFDSLWGQMRGVARQVGIDAVKQYCEIRQISEKSLSQSQRDAIMNKAREDLRAQFQQRLTQEAEIRKIEENQRALIAQFKAYDLLECGRRRHYPCSEPIERMLDRLHGQVERVMRDTGRSDLIYRRGDLHDPDRGSNYIGNLRDTELFSEHVAELIFIRYTQGEEKYFEKLKERGYLPPVSLQQGDYQGKLVITAAPVEKALNAMMQKAPSKADIQEWQSNAADGCKDIPSDIDVSEAIPKVREVLTNMKGKDVELNMRVFKKETEDTFRAQVKADFASRFPDYHCGEASEITEFRGNVTDDRITMQATSTSLADNAGGWIFEGTLSPTGELSGSFRMISNDASYQKMTGTSDILTGTWQVRNTSP